MELERKLTKKRCFFGYSEKDTRMAIEALQSEHQKDIIQLTRAIHAEKEKNESLKSQLAEINELPIKNNLEEELTSELKQQFFQQTRSLLALREDLEKQINLQKQKLENKIQQRELSQKRIRETLEYFNTQKNELEKELIK